MNDFPDTPGHGDGRDDERVRRLLDAAVSDIEPHEALGSIHRRRMEGSLHRKRSWLLGIGAAVVATAATVAAVTVLGDGTTLGGDRDDGGPAAHTSVSPTKPPDSDASGSPAGLEPSGTTEAPPTVETVPVYYVGDTSRGPRLYREFHRVTTNDAALSAVNEAISGSPHDSDYRSAWPSGVRADSVRLYGDYPITVDLSGRTADALRDRTSGMSKQDAEMAVQQVIYTAQGALQQGRPAVEFLVDGRPVDTLLGVRVSEPVSQGAASDVLAQVWIIDPAEGAHLTAPFKVSGLAAAFEANVQWELRQGDRVVKKGFTTAAECCTMAPYSFTVDAPPGDYTLVVHDSDPSGGEGFAPWQDTKDITVVP